MTETSAPEREHVLDGVCWCVAGYLTVDQAEVGDACPLNADPDDPQLCDGCRQHARELAAA